MNAVDGNIRFCTIVRAVVVVDVVVVLDVFVGGAALVVVVVVVVVSSPSFITFRSSDSFGAIVVPRVVEISVVVSVETRFSFMSTVVVVVSDVGSTVVVSSDRDDASVDVVRKVVVDVVVVVSVVVVATVGLTDEEGVVVALVEDTEDVVELVDGAIEDAVTVGTVMVVVMMVSVVCSG